MNTLQRYITKLRTDGMGAIVRRRYRWYRDMIRVNNRTVGRLVELSGNRIRIGGLKFSVDSACVETAHKSTLLFGLHEMDERALVQRWLPKNLPVVELGGGLGVVSCIANRRLERPDRHVVLEASPQLVELLTTNRDLNRCRFQILNKALAYGSETVSFSVESNLTGSRVGGSSATVVSVPATSLEKILDEAGFDECAVICDIEGAEIALIDHELALIKRRVPFLLIELHPQVVGREAVDRMMESLRHAGYSLQEECGHNVVIVRDAPG